MQTFKSTLDNMEHRCSELQLMLEKTMQQRDTLLAGYSQALMAFKYFEVTMDENFLVSKVDTGRHSAPLLLIGWTGGYYDGKVFAYSSGKTNVLHY